MKSRPLGGGACLSQNKKNTKNPSAQMKYFHELTEEDFLALMANNITWNELSEIHPQPKWCQYFKALDGPLGCWSLVGQK